MGGARKNKIKKKKKNKVTRPLQFFLSVAAFPPSLLTFLRPTTYNFSRHSQINTAIHHHYHSSSSPNTFAHASLSTRSLERERERERDSTSEDKINFVLDRCGKICFARCTDKFDSDQSDVVSRERERTILGDYARFRAILELSKTTISISLSLFLIQHI